MKRLAFLKTLCAASAAGLSACSTTGSSSSSAPGTGAVWPPAGYTKVRAFVYDCEAELHNMSFWRKDGTMHTGVINAPGVVLSDSQVKRLVATANTPHPLDKYKPCYVPHHAFVFYDAADKPVATLEVCFTCRRHIATPKGTPDHIDYAALWNLLHEVGVPAERGPTYYRDLYRKTKGRA